jgi:hypothetical protein
MEVSGTLDAPQSAPSGTSDCPDGWLAEVGEHAGSETGPPMPSRGRTGITRPQPLCVQREFASATATLDPVAEGHAAVGFAGAAFGGGLGVAVDHLAGLPAGEAHEVAFVAAGGQPGVGERMPELVGVQAGEPDARATVGDDLEEA